MCVSRTIQALRTSVEMIPMHSTLFVYLTTARSCRLFSTTFSKVSTAYIDQNIKIYASNHPLEIL